MAGNSSRYVTVPRKWLYALVRSHLKQPQDGDAEILRGRCRDGQAHRHSRWKATGDGKGEGRHCLRCWIGWYRLK